MTTTSKEVLSAPVCYHCGEDCIAQDLVLDEKHFCCEGCKTVFEILDQNHLCDYYQIDAHPGKKQLHQTQLKRFDVLNDPDLKKHFVVFQNDSQTHVQFDLPNMHCNSCIWLLEQLHQFQPAIYKSTVQFIKKQIRIVYDHHQIHLSEIAKLLTQIGYEPHLSLEQVSENPKQKAHQRKELYRIGIAGFCFANIMMLSFPEYFGIGNAQDAELKRLFSYLILLFSLPSFFYSGMVFFVSGWKGLMHKHLNIDLPIAIAILVTFVRSVFEIVSGTGAGFMDSMTGIIFFMLVGRFFQDKTYHRLSFERDFKSYFPISTTCIQSEIETQIPISKIQVGDILLIRNQELIPADAVLLDKEAFLDYSFITGEAELVPVKQGQLIYAGVRLSGAAVRVQTVKRTEQSYLTSLWNQSKSKNAAAVEPDFIHKIATVFGFVIIAIGVSALFFWMWKGDTQLGLNALTSVLIVACPCSLLLTSTFTFGHVLNMMSRNDIFLKNAAVVDKMSQCTAVVFDKTGTMTIHQESEISMEGKEIANHLPLAISLSKQSTHPLSKKIASIKVPHFEGKVIDFQEIVNMGIQGVLDGKLVKLGNDLFVIGHSLVHKAKQSVVHLSVNEQYVGAFYFSNKYRFGIDTLIRKLKKQFQLFVLSGDHNSEKSNLAQMLGDDVQVLFEQSPSDKLNFVKKLSSEHQKVMMIGDGLNDAVAMEHAHVGIAVSDEFNQFNPACDVIIKGSQLSILDKFIAYCKSAKYVIYFSFFISILYNLVGLSFAVQGTLQPVIAAILMPVSSISIVIITTLGAFFAAKMVGLKS